MKDTEKTAFSSRLHEALDAAGIPHRGRMRRLAELADVSDNAAKKWLEGLSIPNRERWEELACAIGADWRWLFLGEPSYVQSRIGRIIRDWRKGQDPVVPLSVMSDRTGIALERLAFIEEGKSVLSREEIYRLDKEMGFDFISAAAEPDQEALAKLGNRVQLEEVLHESTKNEEGALIPVYGDICAAAGNGMMAPDVEVPTEFVWIRASRLSLITNRPENVSIIRASGDSMEGTFSDGDLLLIQAIDRQDITDGVHVFRIGDELFVKRLQRLPGGRCLAISDNKAYEPFEINLADEDVQIIARVILAWTAKTL